MVGKIYILNLFMPKENREESTHHAYRFHALLLIACLADEDSLMCCIVRMGRQIVWDVLYIFSVRIPVSHALVEHYD